MITEQELVGFQKLSRICEYLKPRDTKTWFRVSNMLYDYMKELERKS